MSQARRNRKQSTVTNRNAVGTGLREIIPIFFGFAGLYLFFSLLSYYPLDPGWSHSSGDAIEVRNIGGPIGAMFADVFFTLFGYFAYLFPAMVAYLGWLIYKGRHHDLLAEPKVLVLPSIGFLLTLSAGCGLAIVHFSAETAVLPSHAGGILGTIIGKSLVNIISSLGATLLLLALFFTGITLLTGLSWLKLMDLLGAYTLRYVPMAGLFIKDTAIPLLVNWIQIGWRYLKQGQHYAVLGFKMVRARVKGEPFEFETETPADTRAAQQKRPPQGVVKSVGTSSGKTTTRKPTTNTTQKTDNSDKLKQAAAQRTDDDVDGNVTNELEMKVRKALRKVGGGIGVKSVQQGPLLLKVDALVPEQTPDKLEKIYSKLVAELQTDKIRVVSSSQETVSLEIPHSDTESVYLSGLLIGNAYRDSRSSLTVALGKDTDGKPVMTDLSRMPHLLIAGQLEQDIDIALHAVLLSLVYRGSADEMRLILVDSKRKVLNSHYANMPHLLTPVIRKPDDALQAFRWCVAEMERRYRLMADLGVRNIDDYNRKLKNSAAQDPMAGIPINLSPIPYIVLAVHEFDELLGETQQQLEDLVTRLSQKARASGIHMVLATRHPSVDVITGLMKTNFPTRIAFQVENDNDSRNILGLPGAEKLLGGGDMLYLTPGPGTPARIHGAYVTSHEIKNVVDDLKQQGAPEYEDLSLVAAQ